MDIALLKKVAIQERFVCKPRNTPNARKILENRRCNSVTCRKYGSLQA